MCEIYTYIYLYCDKYAYLFTVIVLTVHTRLIHIHKFVNVFYMSLIQWVLYNNINTEIM